MSEIEIEYKKVVGRGGGGVCVVSLIFEIYFGWYVLLIIIDMIAINCVSLLTTTHHSSLSFIHSFSLTLSLSLSHISLTLSLTPLSLHTHTHCLHSLTTTHHTPPLSALTLFSSPLLSSLFLSSPLLLDQSSTTLFLMIINLYYSFFKFYTTAFSLR